MQKKLLKRLVSVAIATANNLPNIVQSTLGFTIMGIPANLDLATGRAVTELCQYLNSDLVFSDLKFLPLCLM